MLYFPSLCSSGFGVYGTDRSCTRRIDGAYASTASNVQHTVGDGEIHDVGEILEAIVRDVKSLDEIKQTFHSKDGKLIYLTDDEIDSVIGTSCNNASSDEGTSIDCVPL